MSAFHTASLMTGVATALALSSAAHAGVFLTEEEATVLSDVVITGTVTDVTCTGWAENNSEQLEYSYKSIFEAEVTVYAVDKGEVVNGDVLTISFSHLVDYVDDAECGWQEVLIAPGTDAKFFLYEAAEDVLRQTSGTEPTYTEDNDPMPMPECGPSDDTGITDTGSDEEETEDTGAEPEQNVDDEGNDDNEKDGGCQVVPAPAGLMGLLPILWALAFGRRDD